MAHKLLKLFNITEKQTNKQTSDLWLLCCSLSLSIRTADVAVIISPPHLVFLKLCVKTDSSLLHPDQ